MAPGPVYLGAMNRFEPSPLLGREAQIRYLDGDFQVLVPGDYVRCAVTAQPIRLDELRYWSVARQEPYLDAATAFRRDREINGGR